MRVHLFKSSYRPFVEMLRAESVPVIENRMLGGYERKGINEALASARFVEIVAVTGPMFYALAKVIVAWINSKASRKVQIGHGGFLAEGMAVGDVVKLLQEAERLDVIDTDPDGKPGS